ncbi:MAG TPA: 5-formyltetrahydrofolate cyclo-ligase [Mycobacterium sp.]|nr:5-formyltetrahydrofolate cyclo-ligase [Mycobacterium sp.]
MATADKSVLRERLLAARRAVAPDLRAREARTLADHLDALTIASGTVCAYVPVGTEPGSIAMLDGLRRRGLRVLLPVVGAGENDVSMPLMWGEYHPGGLVAGRFGLLEPASPWLPPAVLAEAAVVIVPALAVDRRGVRLGRGAGCYDRSLPLRAANAQLIAVVRDAELIAELPSEPHDVPMTHALTPRRGIVALGPDRPK